MRDVRAIIASFTVQLTAIIEETVLEKARASVLTVLGGSKALPRLRGRTPKALGATARPAPAKPRKKAPLQLCPVPGCKNPAAPIFGMVCAKHKDLPKAKIRKYREARRLAKLKGSGSAAPTKRRAKPAARKPKPIARTKKQARKIVRPRKATLKPAAPPAPPSGSTESPAASSAQ